MLLKAAARAANMRVRFFASARQASTLVYVDHNGEHLANGMRNTVTAASQIGGEVTALVAGGEKSVVEEVSKLAGISKVLYAPGDAFKGHLPEAVAPVLLAAQKQFNFTHILSSSSSVGKNILPRVAAKLDVGMLSDITGVESEDTFKRLIYAGNVVARVKSNDSVKIATVRPTAFDECAAEGGAAAEEALEAGASQDLSTFVSQSLSQSDRPSLEEASKVVSGGRALKSEENFELIYKLADKMGAAAGATRAAVDAGYCPNDMQVGQTGKVIAPELYLAVGVSGAIQHLAGMKDSKVIACINKDPEAPIFQVSDYGLEADLFKAVPELMEKL